MAARIQSEQRASIATTTSAELPVIARIVRPNALERIDAATAAAWMLGVVAGLVALGSAALTLRATLLR